MLPRVQLELQKRGLGLFPSGGDCPAVPGAVCSAWCAGVACTRHQKRPWAAAWEGVREGRLGPPVKVKVCVTLEQSAAIGQAELRGGNQAADSAATARAGLTSSPFRRRAVCEELGAAEATRARQYRGAAKICAADPRPAAIAVRDGWRASSKSIAE